MFTYWFAVCWGKFGKFPVPAPGTGLAFPINGAAGGSRDTNALEFETIGACCFLNVFGLGGPLK